MKELKEIRELRNKMFPPKLEAGCEVKYWIRRFVGRGYSNVYYKGVVVRTNYDKKKIDVFVDKLKNLKSIDIREIHTEILGKDLTILDILRMLEKREMDKTNRNLDGVSLTMYGEIQEYNSCGEYEKTLCKLDLSKPNIQDQPEETIIKLNKLLCN